MKEVILKSKRRKWILSMTALLLTIVISSLVGVSLANQEIEMAVIQVPNIDIVLAKSDTRVDLTNFEENIKSELDSRGISRDKVKVSAIETQEANIQTSFNWEEGKDVSSSIGSISITNGGRNVVMYGNKTKAGKNAIWIIPDGNQDQEFNMTYNIDFGDSFNAAGMLLRVKKSGNTLTGYMLSFNNSNWQSASGANGAIWEFSYVIGQNTTNMTKTLKKALTINKSGTLNVKASDTEIIVSGGGLASPVTYKTEKTFGNGFGFFSDHYSHNCAQIGNFTLKDIELKTSVVKDFNEVLQQPSWRDGSLRVLVNVTDSADEQFDNNNQVTSVVSKLFNDDIYYVGWGTTDNISQIQNVIQKNDNKGIFIYNNNYSNAITETAKYIKSLLTDVGESQYIIVGEDASINITPSNLASGTTDEEWPNGRWKAVQDMEYFENNNGQYELTDVYTDSVISEFTKVGKYEIFYEDEKIIPGEVYVHRRPVASFNMQISNGTVTLESTSYDLDKQSQNNGISEEEWSYKKTEDTDWTTGKISTIEDDQTYIVRLRVKDYQETWSRYETKYIAGNGSQAPVASYKILNPEISVYKKLEVVDASYDPAGLELTTYTWKVTNKAGTVVYTGTEPLLDYNDTKYGIDEYTMSLIVTNSKGTVSEEYQRTYTITDDITAPEFVATPIIAESINTPIDVKIEFTDNESGFKAYKYAITNSKDEPTEWSEEIANQTDVISIDSTYYDNEVYLHIIGIDQKGNESKDRVLGPYFLEKGYVVEVQAVDSTTTVGVEGIEFKVTGEYEDGTSFEINSNVATTNKEGKIILEEVLLKKISKLKIENTAAKTGYNTTEYKIVTTDTTDYNISVQDNATSNEVETIVSEDKQQLTIKIPLEKQKVQLKISNVDSEINTLKLNGAEFVIKNDGLEVGRGITENGELVIQLPVAEVNSTVEYVLEQVSALEGYTPIQATTLNITFDENGSIEKIAQKWLVGNSNVEIIDDGINGEILVKNERTDKETFSVNINVVDKNYSSQKIEGSSYKIKVSGENGLDYETEAKVSDANGDILIEGLFGRGTIRLTFIHETAAEGYMKETEEKYITITRDTNGVIEYSKASYQGIFEKVENSTVYVTLANEAKESKNSLKIRVVSNVNSTVGIEGIGFEVRKLLGDTLMGEGYTDENGTFEICPMVDDGIGEVVYKIVPKDTTQNGVTLNNTIIKIAYDNNKNIENAEQITANADTQVYYSNEEADSAVYNIANVTMRVETVEVYGENQLIILKQDENTKDAIDGVQYKIKIQADMTTTEVKTTENGGKIYANLPESNNITVEITEVKTTEEYKLDDTVKKVVLKRDEEGKLVIVGKSNLLEENISITEDGNLQIIEEGKKIANPKLQFKIGKTNKDGNLLLGGVKFTVTEEKSGYSKEIVTDKNGYITLGDITITEARDYRFIITETETIKPYELPDQSLIIEIHFEQEGSIIKYVGETYLSGDAILANKRAVYDEANNELSIELDVKNYTADDFNLEDIVYELDLQKVDKEGNKVEGSKYDIEVRPYGESSILSKGTEVTDEVEVTDLILTKETTTILLKETEAGLGFNLDETLKVVSIYNNGDGDIECLTDTTSGELEITIEDVTEDGITKKRIHIKINTVDAEEMDNSDIPSDTEPENPDPGTDEEDPEDNSTFKVRIYSRNYGTWSRSYQKVTYGPCTAHKKYYYGMHIGWYYCKTKYYDANKSYPYGHVNTSTEYHDLVGAQRLNSFFGAGESSYGFYDILDVKTTITTRLVEDGIVSNEIYEQSKSIINSTTTEETGTHSVYFHKDYSNKTVEFTITEEVPSINHKRIKEKKAIVTFDENGKIITGTIQSEGDLEDFAIGGISANGIVNDIEITKKVDIYQNTGKQLKIYADTISVEKFNSIGKDVMYLGILNETISNPTEIQLDLEDYDTQESLSDGEFNIIVSEVNEDGTTTIREEHNKTTNSEGKLTLKLEKTYANRTIRYSITQITMPVVNGVPYKSATSETIQVDVLYDDDGNILTTEILNMPENAELVGAENGKNKLVFGVTNEIVYNFSINVNKVGEDDLGLKDVRINTKATMITNATTQTGKVVFSRGSALSDENGNVKLKVYLPMTGTYAYYNKTVQYDLSEYYVADGYKAITEGLTLRVKYDKNGNVEQAEVTSANTKEEMVITGIENDHINIKLKNEKLDVLPKFEIEEVDADDDTLKLSGKKYKVTSWDEATYGVDNLDVKEEFYSNVSDESGRIDINFEKGHALKTIIYTLAQVGTPDSYKSNENIVVRVVYDANGKVSKAEIISKQQIDKKVAVTIIGNPVGNATIQLKVRNELKPQFEIRLTKYDSVLQEYVNGKEFKAYSYLKNEDGKLGDLVEERESLPTEGDGFTTIGFRKAHPNETVVYKIFEINQLEGETLEVERGILEVTFDQYGNEQEAKVEGEYLTGTNIDTKQKYANVKVTVESFRINVQLRSNNTNDQYSLAGAVFNIETSMKESGAKRATNALGNVIEIVGERHKGKEVTYYISQEAEAYDYEGIGDFELKIVFDENGIISSCTPMAEGGKFDVITTARDVDGVDMTLRIWTVSSPRNSIELDLFDEENEETKISSGKFEISTEIDGEEKVYELEIVDGNGKVDLGPDKHLANKNVLYTIKQTEADFFYIKNPSQAQIAVQYDEDGNMIEAKVVATDGYMKVVSVSTDGRNVKLETKNKRKLGIEVINEDKQTGAKIDNSSFTVTLQSDGVTYTDTNETNTDGETMLMVGPYFREISKTYELKQVAAWGYTKVPDFKFIVTYDERGYVTECDIPEEVEEYVEVTILNKSHEVTEGELDIRDISIKIKNEPKITMGIKAVDENTGAALAGGKYQIREKTQTTYQTVITTTDSIAHAAVEDTQKGTVRTYEIVEMNAPVGYKYKSSQGKVIATIEATIDTDGHIVPENTKITGGYEYAKLITPVDKLSDFDIDIEIKYEEVEEFTIVVENVSMVDGTTKIESTLTATIGTGSVLTQKTDAETGIAEFNFGKQSANARRKAVISQGNVKGSYSTSAPIHLDIQFDESGKIKSLKPISGDGIATSGVSYVIENTGKYTVKIKLMNQPETSINILNVEEGNENTKLANTLKITGQGFNETKTQSAKYGEGIVNFQMDSAPKSRTVYYTITQSSVSRGYGRNNNMRIKVEYDADGRITSAEPYYVVDVTDSSMFEVTGYDEYNVNVKIKNKKVFTVYLETVDKYDEDKKISGIRANIYEFTYSGDYANVVTDQDGLASTTVGTNKANSTLSYTIRLRSHPEEYGIPYEGYSFTVQVKFDETGNISNVKTSSDIAEVSTENGTALNIKVKYTPYLNATFISINSANNLPLSGKRLRIASSQSGNYVEKITNKNGIINIDNEIIENNTTVRYTISERETSTVDYNYTKINGEYVDVTYDEKGYISKVVVSNPDIIQASFSKRAISVKIFSDKNFRISLINIDEFEKTQRILGKYDIVSSKGDKVSISTVKNENKQGMAFVGKVYSGEEVTYTIHQTAVNEAYDALPDIQFKVKFGNDGRIESVTSMDGRLEILATRNTIGEETAHVDLQLSSRAQLLVKLKVTDSKYNSGVENLKFKVINENTGAEKIADSVTDVNGEVIIPISRVESSKVITYRIEQVENKGGYAAIEPIKVFVQYNESGIIEQDGTYINEGNGTLNFKYTKDLYNKSRKKGIEINLETESKFGIGIVNKDKYAQTEIQGTQFYIKEEIIDNGQIQTLNKVTDVNGEATEYIRDMDGSVRIVEYTLTQVQAPTGYRKISDVVVRVFFDNKGNIISYKEVQSDENVKVEVATNNVLKMEKGQEVVHLKFTVENDDRLSFKVVNKDANLPDSMIKGSIFNVTTEVNGQLQSASAKITTDIYGEATLAGIEGTGVVKIYYNQIQVGEGYAQNSSKSGYITVEKAQGEYKLIYKNSTTGIEYDIDQEHGIITIYIENESEFSVKIHNIDGKTNEAVTGSIQKYSMFIGEKTQSETDIIELGNEIQINEGNGFVDEEGTYTVVTGSTHTYIDKKVVFKMTEEKEATGYPIIEEVYFVVEFDNEGKIEKTYGLSARTNTISKNNDHSINVFIKHGDLEEGILKIIKETEDGSLRIDGTEFKVTVNVDGNVVKEYAGLTTNSKTIQGIIAESGIIEIQDYKYIGNVTLTIEETKSAEGYSSIVTGEKLEVYYKAEMVEGKIKISDIRTNSQNIYAAINSLTGELEIIIKNSERMKLEIEKEDENGNKIIGNKISVTVMDENNPTDIRDYGEMATNNLGKVIYQLGRDYKDTDVIITITQEEIKGFMDNGRIILKVHFDEEGKITKSEVTSGIEFANVNHTTYGVNVKIVGKAVSDTITIKVIKENAIDSNIKIEGVMFQVKITPEIGVNIYNVVTSNEKGELEFKGVVGHGNIKVEILEIMAPNGYILGEENGYYEFNFTKDEETGEMNKVSSTLADEKWTLNNAYQNIEIHIPNKVDSIGLAINKTDAKNGMNVQGATFKVTDVQTGEEYTEVTDEKGIAYIALAKKQEAGTYEYSIKETDAPNGYELNTNEMKIAITYDGNGNIIDSTETTSGILIIKQEEKYINVKVENKQEYIGLDAYNIEIINVDSEDRNITIPGAKFDIKITQEKGSGNISINEQADGNGKISLTDINGAGNIKIEITEREASDGYILNNQTRTLNVQRNLTTGEIKIINSDNLYPVYDASENKLTIYVSDDKEYGKYSLVINKVDENGKNIKAQTEFEIDINGNVMTAKTGETGNIVLTSLSIPEKQVFNIKLTEKKAPEGYELNETPQILKCTVTKVYDNLKLSEVSKEGEVISIKNTTNNLIEINFENKEQENTDDLYLKSDKYVITEDLTKRVSPYTKVSTFIENLDSNGDLTVFKADGSIVGDDEYVGTGMIVKATKDSQEITKTIVVIGDITGDGEIKALDVSKLNQHYIDKKPLTDIYLEAADINGDGKISALDASRIRRAYVGAITL